MLGVSRQTEPIFLTGRSPSVHCKPWPLVLVSLSLMLLGVLTIARAEALAGGGHRVPRQMVWIAVSLVAMLLASWPNYRILCRWAYVIYGLALVLLVAVFFFPAVHGAHRWLRFGGIGIQPSEVAKIAFVLALARWLMYRESHRRWHGLAAPLVLTLVPVVLILREPDLGTAMVFLPVLFCMLAVAGARAGHLGALALVGLLLLPLLWQQMSREQRSRVTALFQQTGPGERPTGDRYHLHQSKQVMALGGVWGSAISGEAVDDRAAYHLPEAHTDFVFSIIVERFGLVGAGVVLTMFAALVWGILRVASETREPFGRLTAAGVASLFAVEVLINTAMTVGLTPITGLSLPLISYGGSGLLAHAVALGLVLNVARRPGFEIAREPFRFVAPAHGKNVREHRAAAVRA